MDISIAIVDNDSLFAAKLHELLHKEGFFSVTTYQNPLAAFKTFLNTDAPQLVIANYNLPLITGLQLLDEVALFYPRVKGIIVTSNANEITPDGCAFPIILKDKPDFSSALICHVNVCKIWASNSIVSPVPSNAGSRGV